MSILPLFESLISVPSLSVGGSGGFVIIMFVAGEFVKGLGKSLKFTISAIFCSSMFVELSSLIYFISCFTSVIKSCMVIGFMSILSCFIFVLSFLTLSFFPHSLA